METLVLVTILALTVAVAAGLVKGVLSLVLHLMADDSARIAGTAGAAAR